MSHRRIRQLLVVDAGALTGVLSERNVLDYRAPLSVRDAMARTALTIHANRPLHDVANELADERIGALPVVDADGKLLGIVSYVDALRALAP